MSYYQREGALYQTGKMVLRRLSPGEPAIDLDDEKLSITYENLNDIITILSEIEGDAFFWQIAKAACAAASNKESRRVTRTQKIDFAARLSELIKEKLPDHNNVTHDGYAIVCTAQTYRLLESKPPEWIALIERGRSVPNIADRAYVLLEISACLPARMLDVRKRLLAEAKELIGTIPSSFDRYTRTESYIKYVRDVQPQLAKQALKDALMLTLDQGQRDMATRWRRNLVDLAESISADLSDLISEMSDDDPARLEARREIKHNIEAQALRKRMYDSSSSKPQLLSEDGISSAAGKNLGALIAGRLAPKPPENLSPYVSMAGSMYLQEAYPIFSWFIENVIRKCVTSVDVVNKIAPVSEVVLLTSEIAFSVISDLSSRVRPSTPSPMGEEIGAALIVRPGDRPDAMQFMRTWLRSASSDRVIVCDPYFSKSDHTLLKMVLAECPEARLIIITSQRAAQDKGSFTADDYLAAWRSASDEEPPSTEVIAVGGYDNRNEILIHDRWILSGISALRLGTSFGTIGLDKLSELSPLEPDEAASVASELDKYLRRDRVISGTRVSYLSFTF